MPSLATWISPYLMPALSQASPSFSSSVLIGREASLTSVSPAQNFSKPPPVPDSPTVTLTSGASSWKNSAAACANGKTVDEPSIRMLPETFSPALASLPPPPPPSSSSLPHAAAPSARTAAAPMASHLFDLTGEHPSWLLPWFRGGRLATHEGEACYRPVAGM